MFTPIFNSLSVSPFKSCTAFSSSSGIFRLRDASRSYGATLFLSFADGRLISSLSSCVQRKCLVTIYFSKCSPSFQTVMKTWVCKIRLCFTSGISCKGQPPYTLSGGAAGRYRKTVSRSDSRFFCKMESRRTAISRRLPKAVHARDFSG